MNLQFYNSDLELAGLPESSMLNSFLVNYLKNVEVGFVPFLQKFICLL